jgi:hypothetical protein
LTKTKSIGEKKKKPRKHKRKSQFNEANNKKKQRIIKGKASRK